MVSMTERMSLSTFVQTPTKALKPLDEGIEVILVRRDGADLRVRRERDASAHDEALLHVATLAAHLAEAAPERSESLLLEEFPWMEVLSTAEREDFEHEYWKALRASASLGSFSYLDRVVAAWRGTAEFRADPELKARIDARISSEELIVAARPD